MATHCLPSAVSQAAGFLDRRAPLTELRTDSPATDGGLTLEEVERDHILRVFRDTGGVISAAAHRLGMPRTTLNAMMKNLGISRSDL